MALLARGLKRNITLMSEALPDRIAEWVIMYDNCFNEGMQDTLVEWLKVVREHKKPCMSYIRNTPRVPSTQQTQYHNAQVEYFKK